MKKMRIVASALALSLCIVLLTGCGSKEKTLELAYDNTAEEAIIASMIKQLVESRTDIKVNLTGDYPSGGTVMHPAMMNGEIDMFPEYTGTGWLNILKHTDIPPQEELNEELFSEYQEKFKITWCGLYGFNNAFGLAVSQELAEKYNLETYSDLAKVSDRLVFGAEGSFYDRPDGYENLCSEYGMKFKNAVDIAFALKYDALEQGQVDVICVWTTDAMITESGVKVLTDDRDFFTKYLAGTVVRTEILEKYPELRELLMLMDGLISDEDMRSLNYQVVCEGKKSEDVARSFLQEKGLL